jgi:hypothetical protein
VGTEVSRVCFQLLLLLHSLLQTEARGGGGSFICVLLGEMGCPVSGAEDDSLGHEPGTLGKARPEPQGTKRQGAGGRACLSCR